MSFSSPPSGARGSSRNLADDGKMSEKRLNFRRPHFCGVTFVMEKNKAANPPHIGLLGADTVMLPTQDMTDLIKELRLRRY